MSFNPDPNDIGTNEYVRCRFRDCHVCCMGTEMLLTDEEADIIERNTKYKRKEFLLPPKKADGFLQLTNVESLIGKKCFFLSDKGKCNIREFAPLGCKLYPLVFNIESSTTLVDVDCREYKWYKEQVFLDEQVVSITKLVTTLLFENEKRIDEMGLYPSQSVDEITYFEDESLAEDLKELMRLREEEEEDSKDEN